jgi:hypothetical protein
MHGYGTHIVTIFIASQINCWTVWKIYYTIPSINTTISYDSNVMIEIYVGAAFHNLSFDIPI